MDDSLSRRDWLRALGATGLAAGLGSGTGSVLGLRGLGLGGPGLRAGESPGESSGFQSSVLARGEIQADRASPYVAGGKVIQPERELPVLHETDVLVVGGVGAGRIMGVADGAPAILKGGA